MTISFLETYEDMQWLRDVHIPDMPAEVTCAIIKGNEDWPVEIELYTANDVSALHSTWKPDAEGKFHRA